MVGLSEVDAAVVVAVFAVRVVEVAIHQVVHVVAVRHGFVSTPWTVDVRALVSCAGVIRSTEGWILLGNLDVAFIEVVPVQRMHAAVVQVVDVPAVADCGMPAILTVHVAVVAVDLVPGHDLIPFITD